VTVSDPRADAARAFALQQLGLADAGFAPASADASFRRYFRVRADSRSWIVMDAPPEREDCRPFIQVTSLMQQAGLHVPALLAQDLAQGYLLLGDLGTQTYLDVLTEANAEALMQPAIDALIRWQLASRDRVLPPYDAALLARELALFPDWYLARHKAVEPTSVQRSSWDAICAALIDNALAQPRVYVHRDYMPRNLMLSEPNPGVLDFQDAVYGPIAYDPICLVKDAFLSWPEARAEAWLRDYHRRGTAAGLPLPAWAQFQRDADWIGLQRHLKVLGVFARINYRDGKPKYLADTPRFVRYVRTTAAKYPELASLLALFDEWGVTE
jgi:aminoglycoside/choline kinase family phosphotransferase